MMFSCHYILRNAKKSNHRDILKIFSIEFKAYLFMHLSVGNAKGKVIFMFS
jgi:hypothetical protein